MLLAKKAKLPTLGGFYLVSIGFASITFTDAPALTLCANHNWRGCLTALAHAAPVPDGNTDELASIAGSEYTVPGDLRRQGVKGIRHG
jgi:hypothetical protein